MRCCEKLFRAIFCSAALLLTALTTQAAEISIRNPQLEANEDGYALSADMNINFNTRLEEAVNRGIVLFFAADFELTRSRWYWLDEQVVRRSKIFRLSYHALTRQYRVSKGALHQSFDSLDDALHLIGRLQGWPVVDAGLLRPGGSYVASLRLRLDVTQLPKPFQLSAMSNRDWTLESEWQQWGFTAQDGAVK